MSTGLAAKLAASEQEVARLRSLVSEWICGECRVVYPGPPQEGFRCVVCPQCSGATMPRATFDIRAAEKLAADARTEIETTRIGLCLSLGDDGPCPESLWNHYAEMRRRLGAMQEATLRHKANAEEERRACASDVCRKCAEGDTPVRGTIPGTENYWWHGLALLCEASRIHDRTEREQSATTVESGR